MDEKARIFELERLLEEERARNGELKKEYEFDRYFLEVMKEAENKKSPCGHLESYVYTEDSGKTLFCLICQVKELESQLRSVFVLASHLRVFDGQIDKDNISSQLIELVPEHIRCFVLTSIS